MSDLPLVRPPQPRRVSGKWGESDGIYNTVLALRRRGFAVYRNGHFHNVNGRILNDRELKLFQEEQPDGRQDH